MISKADFLGYLNQMLALENRMQENYRRLHDGVKAREYKDSFLLLANEETAHARVVEGLMDIFSGKKDGSDKK